MKYIKTLIAALASVLTWKLELYRLILIRTHENARAQNMKHLTNYLTFFKLENLHNSLIFSIFAYRKIKIIFTNLITKKIMKKEILIKGTGILKSEIILTSLQEYKNQCKSNGNHSRAEVVEDIIKSIIFDFDK